MKHKKIIWLDNENKLYVEKDMPESEKIQAEIKHSITYDPCRQFTKASCLHLKETEINGRKADKWLITLTNDGRDYHIFQWIDKKYKTIIRQENSDGSALSVDIIDNQKLNDRKVRKLDMHAYTSNGQQTHGIQWYDNELDIVVRQQYEDDFVDELRNIKVGKIDEAKFDIPKDYSLYDEPLQTAQQLNGSLHEQDYSMAGSRIAGTGMADTGMADTGMPGKGMSDKAINNKAMFDKYRLDK